AARRSISSSPSLHSLSPRPPRPTLFPYTTLFRSLTLGTGGKETLFHYPHGFARGLAFANGSAFVGISRHRHRGPFVRWLLGLLKDRKSTRLNSSHVSISYAVFCFKKKKRTCSRAH